MNVSMNRIKVTPEGRPGLWLADVPSLAAWIEAKNFETIHCFIPSGPIITGADWEPSAVLTSLEIADRVAVATGTAWRENMAHAVAAVLPADGRLPERLHLYDVGEIDRDNDLDIQRGQS
jgi:hypothetical protein